MRQKYEWDIFLIAPSPGAPVMDPPVIHIKEGANALAKEGWECVLVAGRDGDGNPYMLCKRPMLLITV